MVAPDAMASAPDGMVWIPAGRAQLGSGRHYPEERPEYETELAGFWMDAQPVSNAQFGEFVAETGYVTGAEIAPTAQDYPDAPAENLVAGSAVFVPPPGPVDLSRPTWWQYVPGAQWRHPVGPEQNPVRPAQNPVRPAQNPVGSAPDATHPTSAPELPVVQVSYRDALAYADWAGKQLPSEAQWEYAARGGLWGAEFAWGDVLEPGGRRMANYWDGDFPWRNAKGHPVGPSVPGSYPPNGYGLFDVCGGVWEWTCDIFQAVREHLATSEPDRPEPPSSSPCCAPDSATLPGPATSPNPASNSDSGQPRANFAVRVIKGGSFLCSENYCSRYRPAARFPQSEDTATNHLGFRCILQS